MPHNRNLRPVIDRPGSAGRPPRRTDPADASQMRRAAAPAAALLLLLLAGCAADNPMRGALRESIGNPFGGPTEQGFQSLVRKHCGDRMVGGQTVAELMASDTTFRQLTGRLYRGDISNDAFMKLVLDEYPAADANIPTTGCVVRQLDICFNSRCDGSTAESPDAVAAQDIDAMRQANRDELPDADLEGLETLGNGDVATTPDPMAVSPSGAPAPETATEIADPDQP